MKILSQSNPEWASTTIGKSTSSLSAYGCTITCLSMLSDWYGNYKNPRWIARNLSFLDDLIIWKSITNNPEMPFKFVYRYYTYDESRIVEALKGKTTSVILQMNLFIKGKAFKHWVVGIKKIGSLYWIADPYYGRRRFINKSSITGFATFDAN